MRLAKKRPVLTLTGSKGNIRVREITSGKYEAYSATKFLEPHRRDFYSFFLVRQGFIKYSIDFKLYACHAGEVFFMTPPQIYLIDSAEDFGGISINCQPESLSKEVLNLPIIRDGVQQNLVRPDMASLNDLVWLAEKMLNLANDPDPFSAPLLRSLFSCFLICLNKSWLKENYSAKSDSFKIGIIDQFRVLINDHWKEIFLVKDYARRLHVSPGHLNSLAKENTGQKAIELIQGKKLIEAKRLLLYSDLSAKEIAYETGFDDSAYFNRFFKKWNGNTPQQFRLEIREKYKDPV
ncbi:MAG: AraC family transcriptional regulator [Chitinophagales bacterium]